MELWQTALADRCTGQSGRRHRTGIMLSADGDDLLAVVAEDHTDQPEGSLAADVVLTAAEAIWDEHRSDPMSPRDLLESVYSLAHRTMTELGSESASAPRAGAALVYLDPRQAHWAHVGATRVYVMHDGHLERRTKDHSVPQLLADDGEIAQSDVSGHPDAHRVFRSLGGHNDPDPEFGWKRLEAGDAFALCTTGLWREVPDPAIAQTATQPTLKSAADALVTEVMERAGDGAGNAALAIVRPDRLAFTEAKLRDEAVQVLNELVAICHDATGAFRDAAERSESSDIAKLFNEMARGRDGVRAALEAKLAELGHEPVDGGTFFGPALNLFAKLRTLLLKNDQIALLGELQEAEDRVREHFLDALKRCLPLDVQTTLQAQLDSVLASNALIAAMKSASASDAESKGR